MVEGFDGLEGLTELVEPNFFSVARMAPERWAALRADLPLMVVSRTAPPPRVLFPILVTVSQSSMLAVRLTIDACGIGLSVLLWVGRCG